MRAQVGDLCCWKESPSCWCFGTVAAVDGLAGYVTQVFKRDGGRLPLVMGTDRTVLPVEELSVPIHQVLVNLKAGYDSLEDAQDALRPYFTGRKRERL